MSVDWAELELRPARAVDRDAVLEIAGPGLDFDGWAADPGGQFEVGEVYGTVVAAHRLRPVASGTVLYEWLAVAPDRRRQGIGAEMVRRALESARAQGFVEMRLATRDPGAAAMVERLGFERVVRARTYAAPRLEGVDQPRLASPSDAERLAAAVGDAATAYGGVVLGADGPVPLGADAIRALAEAGLVRVGPSERALALLVDTPAGASLHVGFVGGEGAALEELLFGLRVEADARGMRDVRARIPETFPSLARLQAAGYDRDDTEPPLHAYLRHLT